MPAAQFGKGLIPPPPTRFGSIALQQAPATARSQASAPIGLARIMPRSAKPETLQPSLVGKGGGGGGGKKPPRPSRDDRQKDRVTKSSLKKTDKKGRTRAGKETLSNLQALLGGTSDEIQRAFVAELRKNTAPRNLGMLGTGGAIYSGKWRGFESTFEANWWLDQGGAPWTCCICKAPILAGATGGDARTIEHRQPWSVMKTEIATQMVCKDGVHWEVALTADVRAVLQDTDNLEPAHKDCNSSKGGSKDTDSIAPIRRGDCPGDDCDVPNAV